MQRIMIVGDISPAALEHIRLQGALAGFTIVIDEPEKRGKLILEDDVLMIHPPPKINFPEFVLNKTDYSFRGGSRKKGGKTKYRRNK